MFSVLLVFQPPPRAVAPLCSPSHPPRARFLFKNKIQINEKDSSRQASPSSKMLYDAFLEYDTRWQFDEYDALAVLPVWADADDAAAAAAGRAADDISVDALYDLAFGGPGETMDFWVKALTTRRRPERRRGADGGGALVTREDAAIYNNNDGELLDYIWATREYQKRQPSLWGSKVAPNSFGAALSLHLKDPLHKKYASKFVSAELVSE